jgi:hypothetical protein
MKVSMKFWRNSIAVVMVGMALIMSTPVFAANLNPGVLANSPPSTFGELNASWWQWFFSVPASQNPGLATNGRVDCSVGQSGNVWFLAGKFLSGGTFTRSCTIPVGKALFIPLINSWQDNVCVTPPLGVGRLRALAADAVSPPVELHASIDGSPLLSQRAISPVFSYTLPPPPDNVIFAAFGVSIPGDCGTTSSTVDGAVADGFYIMLPPLTAGSHRINFGGTGPTGFTSNVTYNLTVK